MSTALRFTTVAFLLALACAPRAASSFAIYTVGPGCPYATIQAALTASYYNPGEDYIWISNDYGTHTYSGEHIYIADQDVDIEGGFSNCNDYDIGPNETTTISGAGNDGGPVFEIGGNAHVYLGNLVIRDAQRTGFTRNGGGVSFSGSGSLTLGNTTVTANNAYTGGGIFITPVGGEASLTLLANTLIIFNNAGNGGGIAIAGGRAGSANSTYARFTADADGILIGYNNASQIGGGVIVQDLATAHIGSPGYNGLGLIYANQAGSGGGLAIAMNYPASLAGTSVTLHPTDPSRPVRIQSNTAVYAGGGVYMSHGTDFVAANMPTAYFDADGFRFDDNIAPEGAALFTEINPPAPNPNYHGSSHLTLRGDTHCASCNSIDGNGNLDGVGNITAGAAILLQAESDVTLDRLSLRNNTGGNLLHNINGRLMLGNSVLAGNTSNGELLKFSGSGSLGSVNVGNITVADNDIGSSYVAYAEHALYLQASIIDQPGKYAIAYSGPGGSLSSGRNLSNDVSTLPGSVQGAPTFVDAAAGDYHLSPWSMGVDFVAGSGNGQDMDGNPRVRALTSVPDYYPGNALDVGAYEVQFVCAPDEVFCGGFEH